MKTFRTPWIGLLVGLAAPVWLALRWAPAKMVVGGVGYAPDGRSLATVAYDYPARHVELRVFDAETGRERRGERRRFPYEVLRYAPGGRAVAVNTGDGPGPLRVLAAWPARLVLEAGFHGTAAAALSPDGRTLATARPADLVVELWDVNTGAWVGSLAAPDRLERLAFSPDGRTLAGLGVLRLTLWDLASGQRRPTPGAESRNWLRPLAYPPDGATVVATTSTPAGATGVVAANRVGVAAYDPTAGRVRLAVPRLSPDGLAFAPDGRRVAIADGRLDLLTVHDWPSGGVRAQFLGHTPSRAVQFVKDLSWETGYNPWGFVKNTIWAVAWSPDGRRIASADTDGHVRVWDSVNAREHVDLWHGRGEPPAAVVVAVWAWAAGWWVFSARAWWRATRERR